MILLIYFHVITFFLLLMPINKNLTNPRYDVIQINKLLRPNKIRYKFLINSSKLFNNL